MLGESVWVVEEGGDGGRCRYAVRYWSEWKAGDAPGAGWMRGGYGWTHMNRRLPPQHTPRAAASHPLQNPYEGGGNHIFGGCFAATTVADKISNIEGIVERILIYCSPLLKPTSRCRRSLASARGTTLSRRRRRQRSQPPRARRRRSRRRSRSPRLTVRPSPLPVTLDPLKKLSDSAWLGDTGLRARRAQLHRHPTYDHTRSHYASVRSHSDQEG